MQSVFEAEEAGQGLEAAGVAERQEAEAVSPPVYVPGFQHSAPGAVRAAAVITLLVGAVNVWSAVAPSVHWRRQLLADLLPVHVIHAGRTLTVVLGFALVYLGAQLWRHKRRAWQMTTALLCASFVLHLLKGLDYEEAAFCLLALGLLWPLRRHFRAGHDPESLGKALRITAFSAAAAAVYGIVGFTLLRGQFGGPIGRGADALLAAWTWFFTYDDAAVRPLTHRALWFVDSLDVIGITAFISSLLALSRPLLHRGEATDAEREEVRGLLWRHAHTDLAHFCLLPDKTYFWAGDRSGVIAYKVVGNAALALGDPIAAPAMWPALAAAFLEMCADCDWRPAFYQITPEFAEVTKSLGLSLLKVGEDARIDLHAFSLTGKAGKGYRGALNALEKQGVRAVWYDLKADPDNIAADLRRISDAWLRARHGSEKTYSLGYFDPHLLREYPLVVAFGPDGKPLAFESLVPMYAGGGWAGDLNRALPDAPKRIQEYLILKTALMLKEQGYRWYGQGLAPLATMGDPTPGEPPISERGVKLLFGHFNVFYGFVGLRAFKAKFDPVWESRYLACPGTALLPKIAAAIVRADSRGSLLEFLRSPLKRKRTGTFPPEGAAAAAPEI